LGGEYAPSVGIGESFFDGRQKTAMLSKRSEFFSAHQYGGGFAVLKHDDRLARLLHPLNDFRSVFRELNG
jgi:hypothetical protein